jgi:hypothetical protein
MKRAVVAAHSPSRAVPGAMGVITTCYIKKRRMIFCGGVATIDLLRMKTRQITLLQFLALRHQWASDQFLSFKKDDVDCAEYRLLFPVEVAGELETDEVKFPPSLHTDRSPVTMSLEHGDLFRINDAFPWELPPSDDLASPSYWKGFKSRMQEYQRFGEGDCCNVDLILSHSAGDNGQPLGHSLALLTAQRNLVEGDELLLHYGREWWTTALLRTLFMAASDEQLKDIRWIESLFVTPEDRAIPFPWIVARPVAGDSKPVLFDMATQRRATDSAALAFCLRRSCQRETFLERLMIDVFQKHSTAATVPLRELRRCLLRDILQAPIESPPPGQLSPNHE